MPTYHVSRQEHGLAVDKAILALGSDLSRRQIRTILDQGGIAVDGKRVFTASFKVKIGQVIRIQVLIKPQARVKAVSLSVADVIYDHDGIVAFNKPAGIAVQKVRSVKSESMDLLAQKLLRQSGRLSLDQALILCHRLDKETTGALLFADNVAKAALLMAAFKAKEVSKTYWALSFGMPKKKSWQCKNHLSPIHPKTGIVSAVKSGGKIAVTDFNVLQVFARQKCALIECKPHTGRSHQLRVHLASAGLPIVGDKKYFSQDVGLLPKELLRLSGDSHFLHAKHVAFKVDETTHQVEAALPQAFQKALDVLRGSSTE